MAAANVYIAPLLAGATPPGGAPVYFDAPRKRDREMVEFLDESDYDSDGDSVMEISKPPAGLNEQGIPVYEVDRISTMRMTRRGRQFFVFWTGYPLGTWKYEDELDGCQAMIYAYLARAHPRRRRN